jgi:alanine dehydrogenase
VDAIKNTEFTTSGIKVKDQISNTYAKTAIIKDKDNNEIEIVFIRHTSKMFSWEKWNKFLMKTIPTQISWFESKLKT